MKEELRERVIAYNNEIKTALLTMYEALNHGQQKQIVKNESVRKLFDRYGIEYDNGQSA